MWTYVGSRLAQSFLTLLVVSLIIFLSIRLTGSPIDVVAPEDATEAQRAAIARDLGLDRPVVVQYVDFLARAASGDFGASIRLRRPAMGLVVDALPASLALGGLAILISLSLGLPIGVYAAIRRGTTADLIVRLFAILGQSWPTFWLGLVLISVFAVTFRILPAGGKGGLEYMILPALTMGWFLAAGIMRLTRSSMLDVLGSDYIRFARMKGLPDRVVVWKHAFKNALLPVITFGSILFVGMLGGAIVTETIFAWPGAGQVLITAVRWRDFPVVQACVMLLSAGYIGANLLVDIAYAYLNPRIRYGT